MQVDLLELKYFENYFLTYLQNFQSTFSHYFCEKIDISLDFWILENLEHKAKKMNFLCYCRVLIDRQDSYFIFLMLQYILFVLKGWYIRYFQEFCSVLSSFARILDR